MVVLVAICKVRSLIYLDYQSEETPVLALQFRSYLSAATCNPSDADTDAGI